MTTHDEHGNDKDLKPYLEGRDGVSATYRKVTGEEPPAGLDALILQAATGAVAAPAVPRAGATRRQHYAMVASLCLGMLLTSLYYKGQEYYEGQEQDGGPLVMVATVDQAQLGELDLDTPAETGAAVATAARSASVAEVAAAAPALPVVEQGFIDNTVEEIQVTGSRIRESAAIAEPAYRQTQAAWLGEIARLAAEAEALVSEVALLRLRLEEERASFAASYPDFDLDAALEE